MEYTLKDGFEAFIGALSSVLFFFALRGGNPGPFIDPTVGFIISLLWFGLFFFPFNGGQYLKIRRKESTAFFMDLAVALAVTSTMTVVFGLATIDQLKGFAIFGSPAMITAWMALPATLLFDKFNLTNLLKVRYFRKGRN